MQVPDIVLPEFLQDETEEQIMARMIARLPPDLDVSEGSYLWDALAPVAFEIAQMKIEAREILKRAFIQFSYGKYLDARVVDRGIVRKPAVKAVGQVLVTGTQSTVIPAGTIFSTTTDLITGTPAIEFVAIDKAVIGVDGTTLVPIEAVMAGPDGNVPVGAINQLTKPINGVTSVTNQEPTVGGTPEESDEDLIARYIEKVQKPNETGNKNSYVLWAKEVPGVGDAVVIPLWSGPGTVKVAVVDSMGNPASPALVQQVQEYISPTPGTGEGKAPVGANVTVVAPQMVFIDVAATLVYAADHDPSIVRGNVEAAIEDTLKNIGIGKSVRYAAIGNAIYDTPGVEDYFDLLVNGGTVNVIIPEDGKAVKGVISLI